MPSSGEQLGFDFDTSAATAKDGLTRWHEERAEALRRLARNLGLPLDRNVEVVLLGGVRLRGKLLLAQEELFVAPERTPSLLLRIDRCTFKPTEIESCVRLD